MSTKVLRCTCSHEWQDARYGRGKRLHNRMKNTGSGRESWRCTVCSAVHESRGGTAGGSDAVAAAGVACGT